MKFSNKILNFIVFFILGLSTGIAVSLWDLKLQSEDCVVVNTDTTLISKIKELEDENNLLNYELDIFEDELRLKESEISYWGRKYDELKQKQND